jgi:hypothetical protein
MTLTPSTQGNDRLVEALQSCEPQLRTWLDSSSVNSLWFLTDPIGALRAANLGIKEELLLELEATIKSLAEKLGEHAETSTAATAAAPHPADLRVRPEVKA